MRSILHVTKRMFCDLNIKNKHFLKKLRRYEQDIFIHQKAADIDEKKMADFTIDNPQQKIAYEMAKRSDYDKELKEFIEKFNTKHKNKVSLLDFSNYVTQLGDLKDKPLKKQDIELIKQFQKRKVDQRVAQMSQQVRRKNQSSFVYKSMGSTEKEVLGLNNNTEDLLGPVQEEQQQESKGFLDETEQTTKDYFEQGPFRIRDEFVIILLNIRNNTKVTTLNRINSVKTLLFMGNGNGIISYAKARGINPSESLDNAMKMLKKNLIAIPRDSRCTLPLHIKKRFQDYTLYLRPKPGFNAHGHPLIAFMLTLAGIDHCGFHVAHTDKNVYNVLKVFYKAITTNTTPQELAEREGFKVYRHQFIRPLTYVKTHASVTGQAKIRRYATYKIRRPASIYQ